MAAHGDGMTIADVMTLTGMNYKKAWDMMAAISRVIPIYNDRGVWQVCAVRETVI